VPEVSFAEVKRDIYADLLTAEQTARLLGIDKRSLARWEREGRAPPSMKIGVRRFYYRSLLKEWILGQRQLSARVRKLAATRQRKAAGKPGQ
jgi:predicted DNA-binding transcriptional regulator AlpA